MSKTEIPGPGDVEDVRVIELPEHNASGTPSMRARAEERKFKQWQLVATLLTTLATSCTGTVVSLVVALKKDNVEQKVDALTSKLEGWESERTEQQKHETQQQAQVNYQAEFLCELNGGPPHKSFPCGPRNKWGSARAETLEAAVQGHTSDRVYPGGD